MRLIAKLLGGALALVVAIFLVQGVASETGEVVVLTTLHDTTSETSTTRLWVVDHDGAMWLRGDAESGWTHRVLAQTAPLQLERNDRHYIFGVASGPA